jgi:hypothetical protein
MGPLEMLTCAFITIGMLILGTIVVAFAFILTITMIVGVHLIYDFCHKRFDSIIISLIISIPIITVWMVIGTYVIIFYTNFISMLI